MPEATGKGGAAALLVLALSACASGPDYRAPSVPAKAGAWFVSAETDVTDGRAGFPSHWWRLYRDETLDQLLAEALTANTDLRVAQANLDRARAVYAQAGAGRWPSTQTSAGARYGREQASWPGPGQAPKQWSYSGGLELSYEVDAFGRVRRDVEAARADTEAIEAARNAVRVAVAAETTRAYVDACALGRSQDVAQTSIELAGRALELITQRERVGAASRLDVERAAGSLAQAQAGLAALRGRRQGALFELAALMGRTPAEIPDTASQCRQVPAFAGPVPVGDGVQLLRRRPDVRQAERRLAADTARIGVATADLYPRIRLGASADYLRNDSLRGDRTLSFGLGPLITWSFPNLLVARSRVEQATAQSAASLAQFDGTVLTALKETEQALAAYSAALAERAALEQARDHAERAYTLADQRYRSGSIAYLDVLVAQSTLIDAQAQLAAADQRAGTQRVSVFRALAGGWEEPVPTQTSALEERPKPASSADRG